MSDKIKVLLTVVASVLAIYFGFKVHWLLGSGIVLVLLACALYFNRSVILAMKANAAYSQGNQEQALALFEKIYHLKHRKSQFVLNYAYLLMKSGKAEQAETVLQELSHSEKNTNLQMMVKTNLATAYMLLDKKDEAVSLLEGVHDEYKTVMVVGNLGYFKILQGNLEEALAFNEEAYEYESDDLTILDNLAQNYYLLGRYEEAVTYYEKVMEKSPKYAESYYYSALALEAIGRYEEASKYASIALEKPQALVSNITQADLEALASRLSLEQEQ